MSANKVTGEPELVCLSDSDEDCIEGKPVIHHIMKKKNESENEIIDKDLEVLPAAMFPIFVGAQKLIGGRIVIANGCNAIHPVVTVTKGTSVNDKQEPEEITIDDDEEEEEFEIEYPVDRNTINNNSNIKKEKVDQDDKIMSITNQLCEGDNEEERVPLVQEVVSAGIGVDRENAEEDIVESLIGDCTPTPISDASEKHVADEKCFDFDYTKELDKRHDEAVTLSRRALEQFLVEFKVYAGNGKPRKIKEKIEKGIQKTWEDFAQLESMSSKVHLQLQEEIGSKRLSMKAIPGSSWSFLKEVKDFMQPSNIHAQCDLSTEEKQRVRDTEKAKLRKKFEKELRKWHDKIIMYDEAEVDFSDEDDQNSPYILAEKCKEKLMRAFYTLCDLSGCNRFTDRPIQKRINLRRSNISSRYDDIDTALEKFINKGGALFVPDFTDIHDQVKVVNRSKTLSLSSDTEFHIAQEMFTKIVQIIKKRREKDFRLSMLAKLPGTDDKPSSTPIGDSEASGLTVVAEGEMVEHLEHRFRDPAELDSELKLKLDENDKLKKSEEEVLNEFARRAAEGGDGDEVTNDVTPETSDDDSEDSQEDPGVDEEEIHQKIQEQQDDELVEEEDEPPGTPEVENLDLAKSVHGEMSVPDKVNVLVPRAVKHTSVALPENQLLTNATKDTDVTVKVSRISLKRLNEDEDPDCGAEVVPPRHKKVKTTDTESSENNNEKSPLDSSLSFTTLD